LSATNSQKPCGETFSTSAPEVPLPTGADFLLSFLNNLFQFSQLGCAETFIDGQFNFRFEPELRLAIR
jgi:hypothetical protein